MKKIDVRDLIFLLGLSLMGYGLFLFVPWVSFATCGAVLMLAAVIMGNKG